MPIFFFLSHCLIKPFLLLFVSLSVLAYFFVDSGGISKCLILVFDQSWGERRIRGPPFPFSICIGVLRLFRNLRLQCKASLHCLVGTSCGVIYTGNPYPSLAPPCRLSLWSAVPPLANLAELRFSNLDSFQAGSLHNHVDFWENLISSIGYSCSKVSLLQIIRKGVKV